MPRAVHIDRHKVRRGSCICITNNSWRVGIDGGIGAEAEDGVCEVLLPKGMLGHGLFFHVACECVLVCETVARCKGVLGALGGEGHVGVGDVDVHLRVCWTRDERGLVQGIL